MSDNILNLSNSVTNLSSTNISVAITNIKTLEKESKSFFDQFKGFNEVVKSLGTLGTAIQVVAQFMSDAVNATTRYSDELNKVTSNTGMSSDSAAKLMNVFRESGTPVESLISAAQNLNKTLVTNESAFQKWGIAVRDGQGSLLPYDQIMGSIIAKNGSMADGAAKAAMNMQLLGRSAGDLKAVMDLGTKGFDDAAKRAENFGLVLSGPQQQAIEKFKSQTNQLGQEWQGFYLQIGNAVIPILSKLLGWFLQNETALSDLGKTIGWLIKSAIAGFSGFATFIYEVFDGVGKLIASTMMRFTGLFKLIATGGKEGFAELQTAGNGFKEGLDQIFNSYKKAGDVMSNLMTAPPESNLKNSPGNKLVTGNIGGAANPTSQESKDAQANRENEETRIKIQAAKSRAEEEKAILDASFKELENNLKLKQISEEDYYAAKELLTQRSADIEKSSAEEVFALQMQLKNQTSADQAGFSTDRTKAELSADQKVKDVKIEKQFSQVNKEGKDVSPFNQDSIAKILGDGITKGLKDSLTGAKSWAQTLSEMLGSAMNLKFQDLNGLLNNMLGGKGGLLSQLGISPDMASAGLGLLSAAFQGSSSQTSSGNGPSTPIVESAAQTRGIVAGDVSMPIAQIGTSLKDALAETNFILRQIERNTSGLVTNNYLTAKP